MHAPVRTIAPAETPVSLTEIKAHCRVDGTDSDGVLTGLLAAAVDHLDGWTGILGRALVTQTWRQDFDGFERRMRLPVGPLASVSSITSRNAAGQIATVSSDNYALKVDELGAYVRFKDGYSFPTDLNETTAVSITYMAGTAAADVPASIKAAIMLLVSHWNEHREAVAGASTAELPLGVNALIAPHRRTGV
jgi:uncharacterized phiE125 gp8 family phage protein